MIRILPCIVSIAIVLLYFVPLCYCEDYGEVCKMLTVDIFLMKDNPTNNREVLQSILNEHADKYIGVVSPTNEIYLNSLTWFGSVATGENMHDVAVRYYNELLSISSMDRYNIAIIPMIISYLSLGDNDTPKNLWHQYLLYIQDYENDCNSVGGDSGTNIIKKSLYLMRHFIDNGYRRVDILWYIKEMLKYPELIVGNECCQSCGFYLSMCGMIFDECIADSTGCGNLVPEISDLYDSLYYSECVKHCSCDVSVVLFIDSYLKQKYTEWAEYARFKSEEVLRISKCDNIRDNIVNDMGNENGFHVYGIVAQIDQLIGDDRMVDIYAIDNIVSALINLKAYHHDKSKYDSINMRLTEIKDRISVIKQNIEYLKEGENE